MRTPESPSETELHALHLDGRSWRDGSVYHDHPAPPLLGQRAALIGQRIPGWAIAAGHTAGWVWTGMGHPEPWSLICPTSPALSPLLRTEWKPRARNLQHLTIIPLRGLRLLDPAGTARDLLVAKGDDDVAAAQLFDLANPEKLAEILAGLSTRRGAPEWERARRRSATVRSWWSRYPVVTR